MIPLEAIIADDRGHVVARAEVMVDDPCWELERGDDLEVIAFRVTWVAGAGE